MRCVAVLPGPPSAPSRALSVAAYLATGGDALLAVPALDKPLRCSPDSRLPSATGIEHQ